MAHILAGAALGNLATGAAALNQAEQNIIREQDPHYRYTAEQKEKQLHGNRYKSSFANDFLYSASQFKTRPFARALKLLDKKISGEDQLKDVLREVMDKLGNAKHNQATRIIENILADKHPQQRVRELTENVKIKEDEDLLHADSEVSELDVRNIKPTGLPKGQGTKRRGVALPGLVDFSEEKGYDYESPELVKKQKLADAPPDSGAAAASVADPTVNPVARGYDLEQRVFFRKDPKGGLLQQQHSVDYQEVAKEPNPFFSPSFNEQSGAGIQSAKLGELMQQYPGQDFSKYRSKPEPSKVVYDTSLDEKREEFKQKELMGTTRLRDTVLESVRKVIKSTADGSTTAAYMLHPLAGAALEATHKLADTSKLPTRTDIRQDIKEDNINAILAGKQTPQDYEDRKRKFSRMSPQEEAEELKQSDPEQYQRYVQALNLQPAPISEVGHPLPLPPFPESNKLENYQANPNLAPPIDYDRAWWQMTKDASLAVASGVATGYVASQLGQSGGLLFHNALSSLIHSVNANDPKRGYSENVGSQLFYELEKGLLKGYQVVNPLSDAPQILAPLLTQTEGARTSITMQDAFAQGLKSRSSLNQSQKSFQNWYQDFQTPFAVNPGLGQPPLER